MKDAVPERGEHVWALQQFEGSLPSGHIPIWRTAVELWEADNSNINPFVVTVTGE